MAKQYTLAGSNFDFGYYAWIENKDTLVYGEERGREGGILYRGEFKGDSTPYMVNLKLENPELYNSIVSYFKERTEAKQYFVHSAYADCYHVVCVIGGKVESDDIFCSWEVPGFVSRIEAEGYEKAEYVPDFEREVEEAKKALEHALEMWEYAKKNPLRIDDKEAVKYWPECFSEEEQAMLQDTSNGKIYPPSREELEDLYGVSIEVGNTVEALETNTYHEGYYFGKWWWTRTVSRYYPPTSTEALLMTVTTNGHINEEGARQFGCIRPVITIKVS
jgi:hypothetical protein